ncbi:hypothetical protein BJ165DRAFT_1484321 [Panaeolus papilionaceus]|nr:hypothetical protein BJ165DRAFT_1484321 [Panaeolus papilionaceus]
MAPQPLALPPTFGIVLVALFLESILYGCGLLQAWLYFRWYNDCWRLKSMVIFLMICETVQTFSFFEATYNPLVNKFGDSGVPRINTWQDSTQLLPNYFSAFVVQIHFTLCIYHLNRDAILLPIIIATLAVIQIVIGIAEVVLLILSNGKLDLKDGLPLVIPPYFFAEKILFIIQSVAAVLCDVLITASLLNRLRGAKTGISKRSTSMLNYLMINAVSRGGFTALAAGSNFITLLCPRESQRQTACSTKANPPHCGRSSGYRY